MPSTHSAFQSNSNFLSKIEAGDLIMSTRILSTKLEVMAKLLAIQNAVSVLNPIQDGHFWGCSRMGIQKCPLPKIYHTYPTIMKLYTVLPYLKKIQKLYKLLITTLDFCWHQHFLTGNQQILLYQEIKKYRYSFHFGT